MSDEKRDENGETQAHEGGGEMAHHSSMAMRGVTRPQMDMEHGEQEQGRHPDHHEMTPEQREKMVLKHGAQTIWVPLLLVLLGVWLIGSPSTFGYTSQTLAGNGVVRVTAERSLAPLSDRGLWMTWSDIASGVLLIVFSALWLDPRRWWAGWLACLVGIWLLFAPVVLWSPSAAGYSNDTLIGMLVIALTILIPGMPGMIQIMKMGPEVPPGWSYNPSSWLQRAPVIALGWVGFFLSRHLAAYQLGYVDTAWDPFFGNGTVRILDSDVSRAWPISDAGLGTIAYALEALMGYMGGTGRWRTMPWMVTFFGILVIPLGVVSIVLVILQPVMIGTWCTLCLATALAMLLMIPLTLDEVWAMGQFVQKKVKEGASFWRVFILGDTIEGGGKDGRTPNLDTPIRDVYAASVWGVTVPWTLLVSALLGIYLMAAPALFGTSGAAADSDHLVGALVVTVAIIAWAEVGRSLRFLNILAGAWFLVAPWLLGSFPVGATANNLAVGVLLILLSIPRGPVREQYNGWDRHIR